MIGTCYIGCMIPSTKPNIEEQKEIDNILQKIKNIQATSEPNVIEHSVAIDINEIRTL